MNLPASRSSYSSFYSAPSLSQRPESVQTVRVSGGAPPHLRGLRASSSSTGSGSVSVKTFS